MPCVLRVFRAFERRLKGAPIVISGLIDRNRPPTRASPIGTPGAPSDGLPAVRKCAGRPSRKPGDTNGSRRHAAPGGVPFPDAGHKRRSKAQLLRAAIDRSQPEHTAPTDSDARTASTPGVPQPPRLAGSIHPRAAIKNAISRNGERRTLFRGLMGSVRPPARAAATAAIRSRRRRRRRPSGLGTPRWRPRIRSRSIVTRRRHARPNSLITHAIAI